MEVKFHKKLKCILIEGSRRKVFYFLKGIGRVHEMDGNQEHEQNI